MRTIFLIFFSIWLYSNILAQEDNKCQITGKVTDFRSKLPISNANLWLEPQGLGTSTNSFGEFVISSLPVGNFYLKVSVVGYARFEKSFELKTGQNLYLEIELNDSLITFEQVQITASRMDDIIRQPQRITLIDSKSIESAPIQNIHELIDYTAGTTMSNALGIYSSKAVVSLHGLPSNNQARTLVVLDGVPLNKSDEGSVNWNMVNKNNIESIKITKGPGPAKFGSGAMGGVIELTSKIPQEKLEGNIMLDYATFNTISANLNLGGKFSDSSVAKNFYWRLTSFGRKSDGYMAELTEYYTILDTFFVPVYLMEFNLGTKLGYITRKNQKMELQLNYFDDKRGSGEKVWEELGAFSTHRNYNTTGIYSGNYKTLKWNLVAFATVENYIRQYEYMADGAYTLYEANAMRQDIGINSNLAIKKFKNQEIQAGFNFKQGGVDGSDTYFTSTDIISNMGKMDNYSLYFQDEIYLMKEKFIVNFGLRYDMAIFHDAAFTIENPSYSLEFYEDFQVENIAKKRWESLSPRIFAQYLLGTNQRIYFSAAKGFRAPILDDMTRNGKKKGTFKVANPNLSPETIITTEIGIDLKISKSTSFSGSAYYSIGNDFMYNISNGDSVNMGYKIAPVMQTRNIGKVLIYGAEAELKTKITKNLELFANYSFSFAQIKEYQIINPLADSNLVGKYLTDVPKHKVAAGFEWKNRFFNSVVLVKHVGETWLNELNTVDYDYLLTDKLPSYTILSLKLEKTFKSKIGLGLSIENIFDKVFITSDLQRNPGRIITLSAKYKI